jgi:ATPase subunit of ABC transporter with duplicated ATPase domains
MLRVNAVSLFYGADPVLSDISLVLDAGAHVGLVGPNGSGKSTLLRLLAGEIRPDSGSIWLDPHHRAAYLPQYPLDELGHSVRESLLRGSGAVGELLGRATALEHAMSASRGEELESLMQEYAAARDELERLDGYALEARMEMVLQGLRLDVALESEVSSLSGGMKTKLSLARILLSEADLLLLDEPTNYLDLPALLWLEELVARGDRTYVIVSHDRRFLDRTVDGILELDAGTHTLRRWSGTYSAYAAAKRRELEKQLEAYRDQQEEIARIEEDIRRTKEQARSVENTVRSGAEAPHLRRIAKKVAHKAVSRERKLERKIEKEFTLEKPVKGWNLHLVDLNQNPIRDNRLVLTIEDLRAGYDHHEVLSGVSLTLRGQDRTALLGENGSGKTTLLRCITGELPHEGSIRVGSSIRIDMLSQEQAGLPLERTVLETFRSRTEMSESEARTYLHRFLFSGDEALKPVRALSYGQRGKLALAILILSGANFLILDEPTSHMDMPALEAIEEALAAYAGPLLVVSHDRAFLERIGVNRLLRLDDRHLVEIDSIDTYAATTTTCITPRR